MATHYIGIDLGAESGRVMLGSLVDGRLTLEEVHRFANLPLRNAGSWHWDLPALWSGIQEGLRQVARRHVPIASVSVDSWGLDCVLLDARGEVIAPVFHYRDPRTERGVKTLFAKVPWPQVFAETGIQFMPINHLYRLAAETPERLARAAQIVPLGDVLTTSSAASPARRSRWPAPRSFTTRALERGPNRCWTRLASCRRSSHPSSSRARSSDA